MSEFPQPVSHATHGDEVSRVRRLPQSFPQPTPARRRDPGSGPAMILLAFVPVLLVLAYAAILAGRVGAQDAPRAIEAGATDESPAGNAARASAARTDLDRAERLTAALARALTVWERPADGRIVYVSHCRAAPGGCEARVRSIALEMVRAGRVHGVDPFLLGAMALRESGLNPEAVGAVGEVGVLQLHPRSARGRRAVAACARAPDRCTAAVIWLAAEGLAAALAQCGDEPSALGAYNRGRCGATSYSTRVLRRREQLRRWAEAAAGEGPAAAASSGPEDES